MNNNNIIIISISQKNNQGNLPALFIDSNIAGDLIFLLLQKNYYCFRAFMANSDIFLKSYIEKKIIALSVARVSKPYIV